MAPKNVDQEQSEVSAAVGVEGLPQVDHGEQNAVRQLTLESFVEMHRNQLESSAVPRDTWPALFRKITGQVFDAGSAFSLMQLEDDAGAVAGWKAVVVKEGGVRCGDPDEIYLVDHAWTFRPSLAREQLARIPGLAERMAALMDIESSDGENEKQVAEEILVQMWRFANTYWVGNAEWAEDRVPVWYIMDEFGARVQHSADAPNVRMVPFISTVDGAAYSLLFPVKDVGEGEEITRDYLEGPEATDPEVRRALMNTWVAEDMTDVSCRQKEPDGEFFTMSRQNETYPDESFTAAPLPTERKIKVYAEYIYIGKNLKHPRFEMVETAEEADVLWLTKSYKQFRELSESQPGKRINQFPYECVLTIKDLLSIVGRRMGKRTEEDTAEEEDIRSPSPDWLPVTYNLKTEIPEFVSHFQRRERLGLDNHWIVKAWNLARGLDMHISQHLHHILRLPFSGPKIAQKYIVNPVLFERPGIGKVKLDIRYILLLNGARPLKLYAYDRFWLRFANVPFDLEDLDAYEKHFTVMNYGEVSDFKQMFCHDFVKLFEDQNPSHKWSDVERDIFAMLRSVFEAAEARPPPAGIARDGQSRAMYAVDLMLEWTDEGRTAMRPKVLEFNWCPDCQRACDYYPEFFDNVFSTLFLDEPEGQNVTLL